MIENLHQYVVTSEAVRKFEVALMELVKGEGGRDDHPFIRQAQQDGIVSILKELSAEMVAFEEREINAGLRSANQGAGLAYYRLFKNTAHHGRKMEYSGFTMSVVESGVCVNGDYGTNPSREEMREMLDAMRELVADWDKRYGGANAIP